MLQSVVLRVSHLISYRFPLEVRSYNWPYCSVQWNTTPMCCLSKEAAHALVRVMIHCRLNYCNSVISNQPMYVYSNRQSVLRTAARLAWHSSGILDEAFHYVSSVDGRSHLSSVAAGLLVVPTTKTKKWNKKFLLFSTCSLERSTLSIA